MSEIIDIEKFLEYSDQGIPVVDVRSPGEFEQGHIPDALSIPLFSDEERAVVGTKYKKVNREAAMIAGLDFVGKKMVQLAKEGIKAAGRNKKLLVHCWRGGMRSESMAWLFGTMGLTCYLLEGGYKSYRRHLRNTLEQALDLITIGGKTGSGKTEILSLLEASGEQIIDLEGLANHKGSAFGALGELPQPTTEQFENQILQQCRKFTPEKRVWIEDESRNVGRCVVPGELYNQMKENLTLFLDISRELRAERLVTDYAGYEKEQLTFCVNKISKKLGGDRTEESIESIEKGEFYQSAINILQYYDKAYMFSVQRNHKNYIRIPSESIDPAFNMKLLLDQVSSGP